MASCSCGTRDKLYPRPPPGTAKGLVGAGCDFVRQSIQLFEFRSFDNRMRVIAPDKTDQNKAVLFWQVWSQRDRPVQMGLSCMGGLLVGKWVSYCGYCIDSAMHVCMFPAVGLPEAPRRLFQTRFEERKPHEPMAAKKSSPLKIIPLGGLDGIGKNMTVFECGDDMVLVDAGLMFPDDSQPGIDLVLPDYTYVLENEEKLRGIVVTHGHEDHTGSLPYLLQDLNNKVPIFSSKLTLGFIEGKLSEFRIRAPKFREVKGGSHVNLGGISLDFFSMTHSIPGALGVFIRTNQGTVMHTGDFKLDQTPIDGVTPDYAAISRFAKQGIDLLLSDSTNATVPGFTKSEAEVGPNLLHAIKNAPGRVFVASFSSHIHRLQQICDAARKCGRKVVVTGRSMLTNTRVARELGYLNIDDADIIDAFDIDNLPDDKIVVMCTGSQGEPLSALSRMANGEHKTLSIHEGDTVILSATPVPGNEKAVQQVVNSLGQARLRRVG